VSQASGTSVATVEDVVMAEHPDAAAAIDAARQDVSTQVGGWW
jgi:hypothetical protein